MEDETGERVLDADAANRLAQQINDQAQGETSGSVSEIETSRRGAGNDAAVEANVEGYNPLDGQERESLAGVYPPDITPSVDVGGSVEDQAALREEYKSQH